MLWCEYCGEEFYPVEYRSDFPGEAAFCSDECELDYHQEIEFERTYNFL